MALYQVREGRVVRWPGDTVRAEGGDIFEGFDDHQVAAVAERAQQILAPYRSAIIGAPAGASATAGSDIPQPVMRELVERGFRKAGAKKKAAKKAAKKSSSSEEEAAK